MKSGLIGKTKSTIYSWSFKYTQINLFWEPPPPLKTNKKQTNKIQQMSNKNSNNTDHYDGRIAI